MTDTPSAVVTGPTVGGIGFHVALALARAGWRVVLAGRSPERLTESTDAIGARVPGALLDRLEVDLADLDSVRSAAERAADLGALHLLVNNAGVMASPYIRTREGLDLQMATNHWGPFLLTGLLLPQLVASGEARVVTVSSVGHRMARHAPLHDPRRKPRPYSRWAMYGQTKLANLLFTYELDRRLRRADVPVSALAAHPGLAGTHLLANGQLRQRSGTLGTILDALMRSVSQSAEAGAQPVVMAATEDLPGGTYVGPGGPYESRGAPTVVTSSAVSHDEQAQRALWELSEATVGLRYP